MSKSRIDSISEQGRILRAAKSKIEPPDHIKLTENERVCFDQIVSAKMEWSEFDLFLAVNLAKTLCDIERQYSLLNVEGYINAENGSVKINPRHKVVDVLMRRSMSLSRSLNIHANATQGRARNQVAKNRAFAEAQGVMAELDPLIAH